MKIIKHGNIETVFNGKLFTCKNCGCEFVAKSGEYEKSEQQGAVWNRLLLSCKCPECGKMAHISKAKMAGSGN